MASGARPEDPPSIMSLSAMRLDNGSNPIAIGGGGGIASLLSKETSSGGSSSLAPMVGSYGTRVGGRGPTLATSFREQSSFVQRNEQLSISEEAEVLVVCDQNSDDEWAERKMRGMGRRLNKGPRVLNGAGGGDSSDDEEEGDATPIPEAGDVPLSGIDDGDVFQSDF